MIFLRIKWGHDIKAYKRGKCRTNVRLVLSGTSYLHPCLSLDWIAGNQGWEFCTSPSAVAIEMLLCYEGSFKNNVPSFHRLVPQVTSESLPMLSQRPCLHFFTRFNSWRPLLPFPWGHTLDLLTAHPIVCREQYPCRSSFSGPNR